MKKITFAQILFLLSLISAKAQIIDGTINDPGDIAFIAYHDDIDGFSFVFLDDCPVGTQIKFIDEEWDGTDFITAATEGEVTWENTEVNTIALGTVIHIENAKDNAPGISASLGTASETDGGFSLDLTEDEIIAITGTRSSPGVFLALIGDSDSANNTLSGTNLTNGETAVFEASVTEGYYSGSTNCTGLTIKECAEQINDISNWTFGSFTYTDDVPDLINLENTISIKKIHKPTTTYHPNPVLDIITFDTDTPILKIEIFNTLGQIVLIEKPNSKNYSTNIAYFNKGSYYVKLIFNKGFETISIQKN